MTPTVSKIWKRPDRPQMVIRARTWTWHNADTAEEGVGLTLGPNYIIQFLTPEQALTLADQLVDAAETISNPNN